MKNAARTMTPVLLLPFAVLAVEPLHAVPVISGQQLFTVRADQLVTLAPGTAFNPGTVPTPPFNVSATTTSFTFDRMMQVGTTIEFRNGNFFGRGTVDGAGGFSLLQGSGELTATLTNVVQDETHPGFMSGSPESIRSGDLVFNVPNYRLEFDNGVNLEVRDPFFFRAEFTDGLDQLGVVWTSDPFENPLPGYLEGTQDIWATSTNRTLTSVAAVPEPGSMALLGCSAGGVFLRRRWNRSKRL